MLTVLYSSSKISGPSVDFAVTFSLPGMPSSSCSTCINICKLRMTLSIRAHLHCHFKPWPTNVSFSSRKKLNLIKQLFLYRVKAFPDSTCILHVLFKVILHGVKRPKESTCLNRYKLPDELYAVCFHVSTYFFCHFLVKAPKEYGTHHHCDI